jgi:hypothetical protein
MKLTKDQLRFQIRMAISRIASSLTLDARDSISGKKSSVTKDDLTNALVFIKQADDVLVSAIKRPRKLKKL